MSGRRLGEVTGQTLTQHGYLGRVTPGSIRPLIDLVPRVVRRCASVSNNDVLMEVLEPGVDHHRVDCINVEFCTQRSRRVTNRATNRLSLSICEGIEVRRVPVSLDK
jgi:hypothetical protein